MTLSSIMESFIENGPIGIVLAIMMWYNYQLIKKLFKIIEVNTHALTRVSDTNEEVSDKLKELTDAQNRRREQFGR